MKKKVIKLNENTLRKIVAESVKKVLKENGGDISADAYSIIQGGIIELREKYGVSSQQAAEELKAVFGIYDPDDMYDDYDYPGEDEEDY